MSESNTNLGTLYVVRSILRISLFLALIHFGVVTVIFLLTHLFDGQHASLQSLWNAAKDKLSVPTIYQSVMYAILVVYLTSLLVSTNLLELSESVSPQDDLLLYRATCRMSAAFILLGSHALLYSTYLFFSPSPRSHLSLHALVNHLKVPPEGCTLSSKNDIQTLNAFAYAAVVSGVVMYSFAWFFRDLEVADPGDSRNSAKSPGGQRDAPNSAKVTKMDRDQTSLGLDDRDADSKALNEKEVAGESLH